jgi:hypothetical protein
MFAISNNLEKQFWQENQNINATKSLYWFSPRIVLFFLVKTKCLITLFILFLLAGCGNSPQNLANQFQTALNEGRLDEAKSIALQQLQLLRSNGTDEAPYIQTLYELARLYRQLDKLKMAEHFYLRTLREAAASDKINTADKEALFREIYNFTASNSTPETSRFVAKTALHSLQPTASYPSALYNEWLMILLPDYTNEKKSDLMLYAAQNLILTGNEKERYAGLYYLSLAYYLQDQKEKFQKSATAALESQRFPADFAAQLHILLARQARGEKAVLRSRSHYLKAVDILEKYQLTNLIFHYDIYSGLAENYYLTRDFSLAKRYQQAAIEIARETPLSSAKIKNSESYMRFLQTEEKKYRK